MIQVLYLFPRSRVKAVVRGVSRVGQQRFSCVEEPGRGRGPQGSSACFRFAALGSCFFFFMNYLQIDVL